MKRNSVLRVMWISLIWNIGIAPLPAATFMVTTHEDTVADDGLQSLREAIIGANATPGDNFIVMSDTLTEGITLSGEPLVITKSVEIDGTYSRPPVIGKSDEKQFVLTGPIQVSADNKSKVFIISGGLDSVVIRDMVITSGEAISLDQVPPLAGGGIEIGTNCNVTLERVTIADCLTEGSGAGIGIVDSTLTLINSRIRDNVATLLGGGIYSQGGSLTLLGSEVYRNKSNISGAGIFTSYLSLSLGTLDIIDSSIRDNESGLHGGGLSLNSTIMCVTRSEIIGNTSTSEGGGVLFGGRRGSIVDSQIAGNASSEGGGLSTFSSATIDIISSSVTNNTVEGGFGRGGGGILNSGTMTLVDTDVASNVSQTFGGGGISNTGTMSLIDSNVSKNHSTGPGGGVRCYHGGETNVTRTIFSGNSVDSVGGAIAISDSGVVNGTRVTVDHNNASYGGGIVAFGNLSLIDSEVLINSASIDGGGVFGVAGKISLHKTIISENVARGKGGGLFLRRDSQTFGEGVVLSNNSALSGGGGCYSVGNLNLCSSVILDNTAQANGGGILSETGTLEVVNSTISGNRSIGGSGGGISVEINSTAELVQSTIANNHAQSLGGGIYASASTFQMGNSILAGNSAIVNSPDLFGILTSLDYNVIGNLSNVSVSGPVEHTVFGVDARLGPLVDNGGTLPTHNLLTGSPAIDAGSLGLTLGEGLTEDQRGFNRLRDIASIANAGGGVDIGAVEVIGLSALDASANESDGVLEFNVAITHTPPEGVVVSVEVSTFQLSNSAVAGVDFEPIANEVLSFSSNDSSVKTVSVLLKDDTELEGPETFELRLSNPYAATVLEGTAVGTINDDELPPTLTPTPTPTETMTPTSTETPTTMPPPTPHFDYDFDGNGVVDARDLTTLLEVLPILRKADPFDFAHFWMEGKGE